MIAPRVRFKRDDGNNYFDWNEKSIGKMFQVTRGNVLATSKIKREKDFKYQYPVFSSQTQNNGELGFYDKFLYEDAITWTTDGANAGTVKFRKGKFYCTNVCGVLLKDKVVPNLCLAEILNIATKSWVTHNGNPKLMNNVMSEIVIKYPTDIEEQQKIADFLSTVDEVIITNEKEVANLEKQKKAVMNKIFSQEVRFKKDDGSDFPEWEEKQLKDVCVNFIVPMRDKPKIFDGNIPWCRIEDIEGKYLNTSLSNQFVSEKIIKSMNLKVFPLGTVICSCSASLGVYAINTKPLITNQTFIGLVCSNIILNEFLLYLMLAKTKKLIRDSGKTTIPYISRENFENFEIQLPCLEEQQRIANFLSNFDEAIVSAKKELELWKELKKGLLQQMFV